MELAFSVFVLMFVACGLTDAGATVEIGRDEFQQLMAKIDKLETFSEEQTIINRALQEKMDNLEAVNKAFKDVLRRQDSLIMRQKAVIHDMAKKIFPQSDSASKSKITSKRQTTHYGQTTVAFLARKAASVNIINLGVGQNVVLDNVVTNIGNAYNSHQGVFIAPVNGLYLITATLRTGPGTEFWANLVVGGNVIVRLNERGTEARHGQSSQTVIIELKKGDDVAIQNGNTNDAFWGDRYSSFAGVLLQEYELDALNVIG